MFSKGSQILWWTHTKETTHRYLFEIMRWYQSNTIPQASLNRKDTYFPPVTNTVMVVPCSLKLQTRISRTTLANISARDHAQMSTCLTCASVKLTICLSALPSFGNNWMHIWVRFRDTVSSVEPCHLVIA